MPADNEPGTALWEESVGTSTAPQVEPEIVPAPAPSDAIVEQWFQETFHNQPFDTPTYNRFHAAKEALKARLAAVK